jgi:hypothetical protein
MKGSSANVANIGHRSVGKSSAAPEGSSEAILFGGLPLDRVIDSSFCNWAAVLLNAPLSVLDTLTLGCQGGQFKVALCNRSGYNACGTPRKQLENDQSPLAALSCLCSKQRLRMGNILVGALVQIAIAVTL